jgi:hypothetical protein
MEKIGKNLLAKGMDFWASISRKDQISNHNKILFWMI